MKKKTEYIISEELVKSLEIKAKELKRTPDSIVNQLISDYLNISNYLKLKKEVK